MAHDYYSYGSLTNGPCIDSYDPDLWIIMAWRTPSYTNARMLMIGETNEKIHQTYSKQEINGDETYSRKVQPSSTKSNPRQLY